MQTEKTIDEFYRFWQKLDKHLNLADILALIHTHGIDARQVKFIPVFTFLPQNRLLAYLKPSNNKILIGIHISKLPVFVQLLHYYVQVEKNEQHQLMDILSKSSSEFLHSYFYGLYPTLNQQYKNFYYFGQALYGGHDSVYYSIDILVQSIKKQFCDYICLFSLQQGDVTMKPKQSILGKSSYLNNTYLKGATKQQKSILIITVLVDNPTERLSKEIKNTIYANAYYRYFTYLPIQLIIQKNTAEITGFLATRALSKIRTKGQIISSL
ncbi:type VI secretion system baseplate protein IglJ [Facilibium subflavum]|uniref:type VI secretion system baseplate protein IglJ n=1 Tax=Facilibium subflavum TaxID=2219058 RepID=UPI000E658B50|nr:type VI secretion system baseplate protein IglJ [Facilibium subflavum]